MIVGFGGHAQSVADSIEREGKYRIAGYIDSEEHESQYKYLGTDDSLQEWFDKGIRNAIVGVGYLGKGNVRKMLYDKLKKIGYELPVIVDPSAIISSSAEIAEGGFVGKGAIINAGTCVGKMAIINTKALVEHGCIIGDFVHIAVGAVLCGQVEVGNSAFVGANATVIQCIKIDSQQIVPAGSTIR